MISGLVNKVKSIPPVLWIGVGLAVLVVIYLSSRASSKATTTSGPVTADTTGSASTGAGTPSTASNPNAPVQSGYNGIANQASGSTDGWAVGTGYTQTPTFASDSSATNALAPATGMADFGQRMQGSQRNISINLNNPITVNGTPSGASTTAPSSTPPVRMFSHDGGWSQHHDNGGSAVAPLSTTATTS